MSARVRFLAGAAAAIAGHPTLWRTGLRQYRRLVPRRWWRRPPFLPLPDAAYLRFRMETAYGDESHRPPPDDLLTYLRWCRRWPRMR